MKVRSTFSRQTPLWRRRPRLRGSHCVARKLLPFALAAVEHVAIDLATNARHLFRSGSIARTCSGGCGSVSCGSAATERSQKRVVEMLAFQHVAVEVDIGVR